MIRLITASNAGGGYLNFMGNEFGHPEWIDFPREGNNWSYLYARRQWSLADNKELAYYFLLEFDKQMVQLIRKYNVLEAAKAVPLVQDNYKQVLIFYRSGLIFVFNFNPFESFTDFGIEADAGEYSVILDSDNNDFMGHDRLDDNMIYKTNKEGILKLYLPTRSAFVLEKK